MWLRMQVQAGKAQLERVSPTMTPPSVPWRSCESHPAVQPLAPTFGRGCELQPFHLRLITSLGSFVSGDCSDCVLRFCGMQRLRVLAECHPFLVIAAAEVLLKPTIKSNEHVATPH